jgi:beta-glucanase (GH16 family)
MRARIDTRPGLWPAFWTLGTAGPWPANSEIEIMEFYRGMLLANAAWGTDRWNIARWDTVKKPIAEFKDPEWSKAFHVWRMEWIVGDNGGDPSATEFPAKFEIDHVRVYQKE